MATMNRCYKILQDIYYSLHANEPFDDDIEDLGYEEQSQILYHCLQQWFEHDAPLTFPSKTINVAVIYARLLEHHFGQSAEEYLQDPLLLYGNDRFYRPYSGYSEYYDVMLMHVTYEALVSSTNPSVKKTIEYFNAEFMIGSVEYSLFTKTKPK